MQESTCALHDAVRSDPDKYIGLLAYCDDGLYEVVDYDDHPDMQELQGWPVEIVDGDVRQRSDGCMHYVFPEEVICFITPDVRGEFIRRYTCESPETIIAWLDGEDEDEALIVTDIAAFEACHPQHTRSPQQDGSLVYYPANQLDTVFTLTKNPDGTWACECQ